MAGILEKLRANPRVREVSVECGIGFHRNSYFVSLNRGFVLDQPGEAHCFGEDTLREAQETLKRVVRCDCDECRR